MIFVYFFQGWHHADTGISVDIGGQDLVNLWQLTAPYMARLIAIIKHSNINLNIINTIIGQKVINLLDMVNIC